MILSLQNATHSSFKSQEHIPYPPSVFGAEHIYFKVLLKKLQWMFFPHMPVTQSLYVLLWEMWVVNYEVLVLPLTFK